MKNKIAFMQITCPHCKSSVELPFTDKDTGTAKSVSCPICLHDISLFWKDAVGDEGKLISCPCCQRKDFYRQKDFNRKLGVILFIIAAILSIWTYGMSLVVLYLVDLFLFSRLGEIVICYQCDTIFRDISNTRSFELFNHEMHDRIVYSGHNFHGKGI